jgi:hypothetical protein
MTSSPSPIAQRSLSSNSIFQAASRAGLVKSSRNTTPVEGAGGFAPACCVVAAGCDDGGAVGSGMGTAPIAGVKLFDNLALSTTSLPATNVPICVVRQSRFCGALALDATSNTRRRFLHVSSLMVRLPRFTRAEPSKLPFPL